MSLIEPHQEKALVEFYRENLLPLKQALPSDTNAAGQSYWRKREWRPLERKDFEIALGSDEQAGATLDRFWAGTSLQGLGKKFARLSRKFPQSVQKSDVSSTIYEMF
ncbi:MAG: hypothetical protein GY844_17470 [Bradyrhizobium sp.]|nr:hypothetical protein [Bradyrhizobium sp.]